MSDGDRNGIWIIGRDMVLWGNREVVVTITVMHPAVALIPYIPYIKVLISWNSILWDK